MSCEYILRGYVWIAYCIKIGGCSGNHEESIVQSRIGELRGERAYVEKGSMATYGPVSGRRTIANSSGSSPHASASESPPKSPRPKTRRVSPTGASLQGSPGDVLQATARMLSPAQSGTEGPVQWTERPPAQLGVRGENSYDQEGGLANGGAGSSGSGGFELSQMSGARARQGMLSPPVDAFAVSQHGNLDLTGTSWGQEGLDQGGYEVEVTRREHLANLIRRA